MGNEDRDKNSFYLDVSTAAESQATNTGNSVAYARGVAIQYTSSAPSPTTGDWIHMRADVLGNMLSALGSQIAGEDLSNDVLKVEDRFSYLAPIVADALVKTGAGFLHVIRVSQDDAAPTAGTIVAYDNTAESGTEIWTHTFTTAVLDPLTIIVNASFGTGLYIGFTTTADVSVGVSYR